MCISSKIKCPLQLNQVNLITYSFTLNLNLRTSSMRLHGLNKLEKLRCSALVTSNSWGPRLLQVSVEVQADLMVTVLDILVGLARCTHLASYTNQTCYIGDVLHTSDQAGDKCLLNSHIVSAATFPATKILLRPNFVGTGFNGVPTLRTAPSNDPILYCF